MSLGSQIAWDDTILPFQLDQADVRGRAACHDGQSRRVIAGQGAAAMSRQRPRWRDPV